PYRTTSPSRACDNHSARRATRRLPSGARRASRVPEKPACRSTFLLSPPGARARSGAPFRTWPQPYAQRVLCSRRTILSAMLDSRAVRFPFGLLLFSGLALGQTPPQPATPEDLAQGERLFQAQCGYCHGPRGDGGRGAVLARPRLRHAPDDQALFNVITRGIPGTQMPRSALSARQARQVVAFVRSLGRVAKTDVPGDPSRGAPLYGARACAGCHTVAGRGGAIGPDLTDIGARASAAF